MKLLNNLHELYAHSLELSPESDPEFYKLTGDLLATPEVQSLAGFVQHDTFDRLQHVLSVSYLTYHYCSRHSLDSRTAARAGVMHDLYYYDWHENDWSHRPHGYRHPGFAVINAKKLCGGLDKKTENIIRRHMWPLTPVPPRYREGWVIVAADKYCAYRELKACRNNKKQR